MRRLFAIIVLAACLLTASASNRGRNECLMRRTVSLLSDGRMTEARHEFARLSDIGCEKSGLQLRYEAYGSAVSTVASDPDMGVDRLVAFLADNPHSVHAPEVRFLLASAYCAREEFGRADEMFAMVPLRSVAKADRDEYFMKYGYTKFMLSDYTSSRTLVSSVGKGSPYHPHAVYYLAYMDYADGKLDEAYDGFSSLAGNESYREIIPYYLLQIQYSRHDYDYVVREGSRLVENTAEQKRADIFRLMAEAWFRTGDYRQALLAIRSYMSAGGEMGREENYVLGYASYRMTDYSTAASALRKVSSGNDMMAQNASYHLADCLLRLGDVRGAVAAFSLASSLEFDAQIREDATFNYGKLLFESNGGSFNQAINVLSRYVSSYPSSDRTDAARKLLVAAYYNSSDYDLAYDAITKVDMPDASINAARQKIILFRGVGALRENNLEEAERLLRESSSIGVSPKFNALAAYFLADVHYRRGEYDDSAGDYAFFLRRSPRMTYEYMMACYGQGYAYMKGGNSTKAAASFGQFLKSYRAPDRFRADAMCRMGDALLLGRDYRGAAEQYDAATKLGVTPYSDYGTFQSAQMSGLMNRPADKEGKLRSIVESGKGEYVDDAHFELGRMLISQARYGDAVRTLESFAGSGTESPFYYPALLNLGLAYLNSGNGEKSLECYDRIICSAPHSKIAREAMQNVREIYVSRGDVESFFAYAEKSDVECDVSRMTRDSLTFRVAQNMYEEGKLEQAAEKLDAYIARFGKGYYRTDALFFQADTYMRLGRKAEAMVPLREVVAMPRNPYTVPSLERLASTAFQLESYEESAAAYRKLYDLQSTADARERAVGGYVDAVTATRNSDRILEMASDVDTMQHVSRSVKRRASFTKARVLSSIGEESSAMSVFEILAEDPKDREGAESAFRVIEKLYGNGNKDECEKRIYCLAESGTTQNYWLGRSFILLGDIYASRGDAFQARATYQSIVDGYSPSDDGVVDEARDRIRNLN